ncbi:hypothetical protein H9P43_009983 [Blastocladiella emersonii ATCC 22665]|nr:hypothetical protein H9P43_009983 [Blastocladiella emersonii ATCC 22665]
MEQPPPSSNACPVPASPPVRNVGDVLPAAPNGFAGCILSTAGVLQCTTTAPGSPWAVVPGSFNLGDMRLACASDLDSPVECARDVVPDGTPIVFGCAVAGLPPAEGVSAPLGCLRREGDGLAVDPAAVCPFVPAPEHASTTTTSATPTETETETETDPASAMVQDASPTEFTEPPAAAKPADPTRKPTSSDVAIASSSGGTLRSQLPLIVGLAVSLALLAVVVGAMLVWRRQRRRRRRRGPASSKGGGSSGEAMSMDSRLSTPMSIQHTSGGPVPLTGAMIGGSAPTSSTWPRYPGPPRTGMPPLHSVPPSAIETAHHHPDPRSIAERQRSSGRQQFGATLFAEPTMLPPAAVDGAQLAAMDRVRGAYHALLSTLEATLDTAVRMVEGNRAWANAWAGEVEAELPPGAPTIARSQSHHHHRHHGEQRYPERHHSHSHAQHTTRRWSRAAVATAVRALLLKRWVGILLGDLAPRLAASGGGSTARRDVDAARRALYEACTPAHDESTAAAVPIAMEQVQAALRATSDAVAALEGACAALAMDPLAWRAWIVAPRRGVAVDRATMVVASPEGEEEEDEVVAVVLAPGLAIPPGPLATAWVVHDTGRAGGRTSVVVEDAAWLVSARVWAAAVGGVRQQQQPLPLPLPPQHQQQQRARHAHRQ